MLAISRFRVSVGTQAEFASQAAAVVAHFEACGGNESAQLVRNLDEPELWAIVSHWENVGAYRRSFSGYEAKMLLMPLMNLAIDEPGAYDAADDLGPNIPRVG